MIKRKKTHNIGSLDVEEDRTVSGDKHFHNNIVQ
jgi:hypothetical protein